MSLQISAPEPNWSAYTNLGGSSGKAYQVDVTSLEAISANVETIVREFNGRLDIFIANSGIPWIQGPALDGELDHYRKVVSTDFDSAYYCARVAGTYWRRQKLEQTTIDGQKLEPAFREGSFVATASISGTIVNIPQLQAAYNAAKAGVIHLCRRHTPPVSSFKYSSFCRQIAGG